ncbi:MAG: zf-HC2 domain-containing protein [Chloroflexi bacterium]|nr:zf-HC2 domain-containing protein [Chloroflexota bacterium]
MGRSRGEIEQGHKRGQLSAYIDNQLSPAEVEEVRRHLEQCPACAEELRTLRETVMLLQELPPAPLPRSFTLVEPARKPLGDLSVQFAAPRAAMAPPRPAEGDFLAPKDMPGEARGLAVPTAPPPTSGAKGEKAPEGALVAPAATGAPEPHPKVVATPPAAPLPLAASRAPTPMPLPSPWGAGVPAATATPPASATPPTLARVESGPTVAAPGPGVGALPEGPSALNLPLWRGLELGLGVVFFALLALTFAARGAIRKR